MKALGVLETWHGEHGQQAGINLDELLRVQPSIAPWDYSQPSIDISLASHRKEDHSPFFLRNAAELKLLEHAGDFIVFTDGSKDGQGTGYGVVFPTHTIQTRVRDECTVFQAELMAIRTAIQTAPELTGDRIHIVTDSLSSLLAILNVSNRDDLVKQVQICLAAKRQQISLIFIHSHVGVKGNERADAAARAATEHNAIDSVETDRRTARALIGNYISRLRTEEWERLDASNKLKSHSPALGPRHLFFTGFTRREMTILTRVRIGHSRLTHGYLMTRPHIQPMCQSCRTTLTIFHIVVDCPLYLAQRRGAKLATTWTEAMKESKDYCFRLLEFLRSTALANEI